MLLRDWLRRKLRLPALLLLYGGHAAAHSGVAGEQMQMCPAAAVAGPVVVEGAPSLARSVTITQAQSSPQGEGGEPTALLLLYGCQAAAHSGVAEEQMRMCPAAAVASPAVVEGAPSLARSLMITQTKSSPQGEGGEPTAHSEPKERGRG